jgi:hypothetical protein
MSFFSPGSFRTIDRTLFGKSLHIIRAMVMLFERLWDYAYLREQHRLNPAVTKALNKGLELWEQDKVRPSRSDTNKFAVQAESVAVFVDFGLGDHPCTHTSCRQITYPCCHHNAARMYRR